MKQVVQNYKTGGRLVSNSLILYISNGCVLIGNYCSLISASKERAAVFMADFSLSRKGRQGLDLIKQVRRTHMKGKLGGPFVGLIKTQLGEFQKKNFKWAFKSIRGGTIPGA